MRPVAVSEVAFDILAERLHDVRTGEYITGEIRVR